MYSTARWHAEGLRWIASLLLGAADFLDRDALDDVPCEPLPAELAPGADFVADVRLRIYSRYF